MNRAHREQHHEIAADERYKAQHGVGVLAQEGGRAVAHRALGQRQRAQSALVYQPTKVVVAYQLRATHLGRLLQQTRVAAGVNDRSV